MNDLHIAIMYAVTFILVRTAPMAAALAAWCFCSVFINVSSDLSAVYSFSSAGFLYILLALALSNKQSVFALIIAAYYFCFAFDTWVYADEKTWLWRNHENIVSFIHVFFIISFSSKFWQLVGAAINNLSRPMLHFMGGKKGVADNQSRKTEGAAK